MTVNTRGAARTPFVGGDAVQAVVEMELRMDKWNLIIDVARCENCNNCVLATKDEHCDNDFPGYAAPQPRHGHQWIKISRKVRGTAPMVDVAYLPTTCNHCDDAPCMKNADGAIVKRDDGIVIIDPVRAKGRRDLVESCPYGAIWWNEALQLPQKWIFDAHLLDGGAKEPRCVQACPTGAMQALQVSDQRMAELAEEQGLEVLRPELGARPRVHYRNLHRYTKCFIGGTVVGEIDGRRECIAAAEVALIQGVRTVAVARTDAFGDFRFDALEPCSGHYEIEITHPAGSARVGVELDDSRYLGTIRLQAPAHPRFAPAAPGARPPVTVR